MIKDSDRRERIKKILGTICQDVETEARWLNTLSLLEYIGARKISKTVASVHPETAEVLDHLADEARHAYAFKRLCVELAEGPYGEYLCREAAEQYFAALDERATEWLEDLTGENDPARNYLLVTTLIERRAMAIYPLYRSATQRDSISDELQQIVVEEQDHRVAIEENALEMLSGFGIDSLEPCQNIERELFDGLLDAVASEIGLEG